MELISWQRAFIPLMSGGVQLPHCRTSSRQGLQNVQQIKNLKHRLDDGEIEEIFAYLNEGCAPSLENSSL